MRILEKLSFSILVLFLTQVDSNQEHTVSSNIRPLLPEADHDWVTIRNANQSYIYIDKTQYLWNLVVKNSARRRLITRSRRFGKSLFLQMTEQFFKGEKDLFKGLFIEKYGNKNIYPDEPGFDAEGNLWKEYPVVYLNFRQRQNFKTIDEFMSSYYTMIATIAQDTYQLQNFKPGYGSTMLLIDELYFKFNRSSVIVLVDDYDFPYEQALSQDNTNLANEITDFFDGIFGMIKAELRVGFLFVMGTSKLPLGDGANNIVDETYNPEYSEAFGFTEEEIEKYLGDHIQDFATSTSLSTKNITDKLKHWYGSYQYDQHDNRHLVCNPVSTILSIKNKCFASYWNDTDPI